MRHFFAVCFLCFAPTLKSENLYLQANLNKSSHEKYAPFDAFNFIKKHDRKNAFQLSFDPYHSEEGQLSKKSAIKRMTRFGNTIIADFIKRKVKGFSYNSSKKHTAKTNSKNSNVNQIPSKTNREVENKFYYTLSCRLKGRKVELHFLNDHFKLIGNLRFDGNSNIDLSKNFKSFDFQGTYSLFPKNRYHSVKLQKQLFLNINANASLKYFYLKKDPSEVNDGIIEVIYSRSF